MIDKGYLIELIENAQLSRLELKARAFGLQLGSPELHNISNKLFFYNGMLSAYLEVLSQSAEEQLEVATKSFQGAASRFKLLRAYSRLTPEQIELLGLAEV